jgi:hypothetical protein
LEGRKGGAGNLGNYRGNISNRDKMANTVLHNANIAFLSLTFQALALILLFAVVACYATEAPKENLKGSEAIFWPSPYAYSVPAAVYSPYAYYYR